jgi:hypothetical protein
LLVAEVLDVARERFVDAQAVVGQQRDQRRRPGAVGVCGIEELLELVAGQADGHRACGDAGALDVAHGVFVEHADLDAVAVEARQTRQAPSDARRRGGPAGGLGLLGEVAGPQRDVVTARGEWVQVACGSPGVPGLQIGEVRAARLRLDKERCD